MRKDNNNHTDSNHLKQDKKLQPLSKRDLSEFMSQLSIWTQKIRAGELAARMPLPNDNNQEEITELSQDINFVAEMLGSLSRDAELQLLRHTEHIAQKINRLKRSMMS